MLNFPPEFFRFISSHKGADTGALRLKYYGKDAPEWLDMALRHIECEQKAGKKFNRLKPELMLNPLSVEQSTSEDVAHLHAQIARQWLNAPALIADLTCGMGIDLRALQETFGCKAIGFELNELVVRANEWNFRSNANLECRNADSVAWLADYQGEKIDLIFIDPARRSADGSRVYAIEQCAPDVVAMLPDLRSKCHLAMLKLSPMLDITATMRSLPEIAHLYVIGNRKECVELFAVLDFRAADTAKANRNAVPISIIDNPLTFNENAFSFTAAENRRPSVSASLPREGEWLFEPSPCAMKGAPWGIFTETYGLRQLHSNTHLFLSDSPAANLPGKWRRIAALYPFASSSLKAVGKAIGAADVAVRNFPIDATELCRRLKIKSGGGKRLIGATAGSGKEEIRLLILLD